MYLSFAIKESQVCRQQQRQWWRFQNSKMQYEPVKIIRWKVKDFVILVLNPTNRKSNTNSMALNVINWDIYEVQLHTCDGWWCYFYFFCFLIDFSCSLFFLQTIRSRFGSAADFCMVRYFMQKCGILIRVIHYLWIREFDLVSNFHQIPAHLIIANGNRERLTEKISRFAWFHHINFIDLFSAFRANK